MDVTRRGELKGRREREENEGEGKKDEVERRKGMKGRGIPADMIRSGCERGINGVRNT